MPFTVALLAHTGLLGAAILPRLVEAQKQGKINLVVLHRPTSSLDTVPADVEKRVLDVATATESNVHQALKGVDILVSTINKVDVADQERFIESLATLPKGQLKVYIPSDFSVNWTEEEEQDEFNVLVKGKAKINDVARRLGLPLTIVLNGAFEPYFSVPALSGVDLKGNTAALYGDALYRPIWITSVPYLAQSVVELVTVHAPEEIANKTYTVVELSFTGAQVVELLTAAHGGKPTTVTELTDADLEPARRSGALGALGVALKKKWGAGIWQPENVYGSTLLPKRTVQQVVSDALAS